MLDKEQIFGFWRFIKLFTFSLNSGVTFMSSGFDKKFEYKEKLVLDGQLGV